VPTEAGEYVTEWKGGENMASSIEVRERQKHHLHVLLDLKKENTAGSVNGLQKKIEEAVAVMDQEDVAWVEKIAQVQAI